jgi:neopullulanase
MTVPTWVQDAIFYHIFPDRFHNGDPSNDSPNFQPWGAEPNIRDYQGGDLRGIIAKFDYLLDLGVNALYLTPIFQSAANHRYHAIDYFTIDPSLGTLADFKALLETAHSNHVRVILDGVFNHTGRGFFAFNDILENGPQSRYKDWYTVRKFPLDAYGEGKAENYLAWWNLKDLPKLNTGHPEVRRYLMQVTRHWLEQGADGWRLDVPAEIDDDEFWAEFAETVRQTNPYAYTVGEVWEVAPRWVGETHFHGLMHYPVRAALLDLLAEGKPAAEFATKVEGFFQVYPRANAYAMYVTLGSHDTPRLFTLLDGDLAKLKLAFLFLFAYPGAPAIYYGDEIGMPGGKDPENRRAFPWDEAQWNKDLRAHVQRLISVRKTLPALRRGDFNRLLLDAENSIYAFTRCIGEDKLLVVLNLGPKALEIQISVKELGWAEGRLLTEQVTSARYGVHDGALNLQLPGWGGAILA